MTARRALPHRPQPFQRPRPERAFRTVTPAVPTRHARRPLSGRSILPHNPKPNRRNHAHKHHHNPRRRAAHRARPDRLRGGAEAVAPPRQPRHHPPPPTSTARRLIRRAARMRRTAPAASTPISWPAAPGNRATVASIPAHWLIFGNRPGRRIPTVSLSCTAACKGRRPQAARSSRCRRLRKMCAKRGAKAGPGAA